MTQRRTPEHDRTAVLRWLRLKRGPYAAHDCESLMRVAYSLSLIAVVALTATYRFVLNFKS